MRCNCTARAPEMLLLFGDSPTPVIGGQAWSNTVNFFVMPTKKRDPEDGMDTVRLYLCPKCGDIKGEVAK